MTAAGSDRARQHYLPLRRRALVDRLVQEVDPRDADRVRRVADMLSAILHHRWFADLEALRDAYHPFDPATVGRLGPCPDAEAWPRLERALDRTLAAANFVEIPLTDVLSATRAAGRHAVSVRTPRAGIERFRVFARGGRVETVELPAWHRLSRRARTLRVHDEIVLICHFGPTMRARPGVPPGCALIKTFRDVAHDDLDMLHPNVRTTLRARDMALMGVPALIGGLPLLLKLLPLLGLLLLVVGSYLGISGTIDQDRTEQALAALTGLAGIATFCGQQWMKYQNRQLRFHKLLAEAAYFRNAANNAGVIDHLIGEAELQEGREALLAWFFLWREGPRTAAALDRRIEAWVRERFGIEADFEVGDALAKLADLGMADAHAGTWTAHPPEHALAILDRRWDGLFDHRDVDHGP